MRVSVRLGIVLCAVAAGLVACQKAQDRPASLQGCTGDAAVGCGGGGKLGGGPPDAGLDAADAQTSDVAVTLSGKVVGAQSDDFQTFVPYAGTATITTQHASGLVDQTTYDGTSYSFADAPYTTALWVKTEPQQGGAGAPYLPTLVPVDTTQGGATDLVIVAGAVLDQIYSSLTLPVQRQLGTSQLVLRFVDAAGKPAKGLAITSTVASTIVYSDQGGWNENGVATDAAALVLIANAPTGLVPVSVDNSQGFSVQAEADTVTLANIQVH